GAARGPVATDQANPSRAAKAATSKREVAGNQMNPSTAAKARAARHSAHDQTNPSGARPATLDQTSPKAAQSAASNQTNPSAGARSAAAEPMNPRAAPERLHYDDAYIKGILQRVKTIAAVGMSANDMRPSYFAMLYLQQKGYRMIPVNPRYAGEQILGETVVASLDDLPEPPDMVQIFRRAEEAPAVVDQAIRAGAKVIWLQLGIRSDEAAARAQAAGLQVVMDRCPKIEYGRLFGEIGWAGVNRRVISAKKGQAMQLSHKKGGLARRPAPRR